MTDVDDDYERDWHQEHKDDVAMGYINEDGSYREPDEPDWDAIAWDEHLQEAHDGGPCTCPKPTEEEIRAEWEARAKAHREEDHDGGECNCTAPF